ncbi:PKD domain-containing protein [Chryseolinea lacunae]|uniref:PKD domain-containing protein n=1 Tax=Chryseolinea lacunae TaxID=2801331 RepID=A0ABS1L190_9BACT|nr:PKD domain-containing protein [Chryseolinea lacunae]MBL0744697.1 PKD domain-containing protein [Chryseolinea lacunae]
MRLAPLLLFLSFHVMGQNTSGLRFIKNNGQWKEGTDFQAQIPGGRLGVSAKGFSVLLLDMEKIEHQHLANHGDINESDGQSADEPIDGHYFQINLLGSNPHSKAIVETPLSGYYNYFLGTDPSRWASRVLAYASILYPEVYAGIDFRVSSVGNNLKYDFIVKPGADPSQIKIEYSGVDGVEQLDTELKIKTALGSLTELEPYSYQGAGNTKQTVASQYRLRDNIVSFSFPSDYDASQTLVIDPLLIFSTYSGSTADNWGSTATPGEHGTLYSAGVTRQNQGGFFPATVGAFQTTNHGSFDMAVIKYDSAGTKFLYATHLGGSNNDSPESLVVDKVSGDLIVLGISSSPDYPTGAGSFDNTFNFGTTVFNRVLNTNDQWDIVVTRLSPTGDKLIGSTYLGGAGNDGLNLPKQSDGPLVVNYGDEMRGDVITDESGHVFITSVTSSSDFPIVNGFDNSFGGGTTDGVVVKLAPDLSSIVWSSYVGGSGFDAAYSIKFDNDKNLVLAGGTTSVDFPVTVGAYQTVFNGIVDGWIARLKPDGSAMVNATFTGTTSFDQVYFVDLNAAGNIFCYGQTAGHMPVTAGVYHNLNSGQFLQKFSPDLSTLQFSTVFGSGSTNGLIIPNISPTAFLVNDCNNIYMAGWGGFVNSSSQTGFWQSSTVGMPITTDAYQKTTSGSDFYFMVLNGDASTLVYSTYLGGNTSKTHVDGGTSRFDKYGIVYHAVCSGCSFGTPNDLPASDFPTTPNAKSRVNLSGNCNNAAFKFDLSSLRAVFDTNNVALTMPGFNNVCYPDPIVFQNFSTGGKTITWDFDDGTILNQVDTDPRDVTHKYQQQGDYKVKLKIRDLSTCSQTDSTTRVIHYFKDNIRVKDDGMMCEGSSFQLSASGGVRYTWISEDGTFTSGQPSPFVQPTRATTYFVTVVDGNGCSKKDTLNVGFIPNVRAVLQNFIPGKDDVCYPDIVQFKNLSVNGEYFVWDFNDGTTPLQIKDPIDVVHEFKQPGVYNVKLKASNPNSCNLDDIAIKTIHYYKEQIEAVDDGEICEGTAFQLRATGGSVYAWSSEDRSFTSSNATASVQPVQTTRYFLTATDAHGCVGKDTVQVSVVSRVELQWQHRLIGNCVDRPSVAVQNLSPAADDVTFRFDFGDGTVSTDAEAEHFYEKDGVYSVNFRAQREFCFSEETVQLSVYTLMVPNVFTPEGSAGLNDNFEIRFGPEGLAPADVGLPVQLTVVDRWGKNVFESSDYKNDWNGHSLAAGVYYVHLKVGDRATCKNWLHIVK